ncbi:MAG: hypothetical protein NVV66_18580, partial [Cellulomonas sp.]|uniref:VOC family protein n=1 Tax=Cellulomonas sp. TaxID=40001 RepID=UPI00258FFCEE|nr:VOC family protein [Cellulomonas sp.]MCR6704763.1 hypothetical protein [Cellulomonas sp.]MCR6706602.1 hypothetical protein [Cellulomonas sp.]
MTLLALREDRSRGRPPVERAVALGARLADPQPDPRWRVLLDPAGHPFCITTVAPRPELLQG